MASARKSARRCSTTVSREPIGYVAHRTIVPMAELTADVPRDRVVLWGGPGFHIVHYPLRHGTLFNIVAVFRTSTYAKQGDVDRYRAELAPHLSRRASVDEGAARDDGSAAALAVGDRDPIRHWHKGRVALIGDAAHPTLQSLAQGACMAIEDGLLPRRAHPRDRTAITRRRSASTRRRARCAPRACTLESRATLGVLPRRRHRPRRPQRDRRAEWNEAHTVRLPGLALRRFRAADRAR